METYDVAIVGGGPSGSTVASLLKKYAPQLRVIVLEREIFPREHIGESLLPTVGKVLNEIGVWDEVEEAGFPIKVGATYKWGTTDELWDFNLVDTREVVPDAPRPGKYEKWRVQTAWQVDRARFDEILLDYSAKLGAQVRQGVGVASAKTEGDSITSLRLTDGSEISARYYVDASGRAGVLRRALEVKTEEPAALKNIAIWAYWDNADWAVTIGTTATRVQVTSLGYGWLWFIPVSATRTSLGLVCPADYYKKSGKSVQELYDGAVREDPRVAALLQNAVPTGPVQTTNDWSYLSERMYGENWFLVGECAGFADPILAAGISMSMIGALECAYTIVALERGDLAPTWLKQHFARRQEQRVRQHIQFANFWYTANAHFTDLMEYTSQMAGQAGLSMDAKTAWQWLGTGGFVSLETAGGGLAGHSLEQITNIHSMMFGADADWQITRSNVFDLDIDGAVQDEAPSYREGKISTGKLYRREGKSLPLRGGFQIMVDILQKRNRLADVIAGLRKVSAKFGPVAALNTLEALETMLREGWVKGSYDPTQPLLTAADIPRTPYIDWNRDATDPKARLASGLSS